MDCIEKGEPQGLPQAYLVVWLGMIAATDARSASYWAVSASVAGLGVACPQSGQKARSRASEAG